MASAFRNYMPIRLGVAEVLFFVLSSIEKKKRKKAGGRPFSSKLWDQKQEINFVWPYQYLLTVSSHTPASRRYAVPGSPETCLSNQCEREGDWKFLSV